MTDPTPDSPKAPNTAPNGDLDGDGSISVSERVSLQRRLWRTAPAPLRRGIVAVLGSTLLALGAALVVLPGPFTLPLVIAGLAVLATEFAWAERMLTKSREKARRAAAALRSKRNR